MHGFFFQTMQRKNLIHGVIIFFQDWQNPHGLEYYNNEVNDLIGIEGNTENVHFFNEKHFLHSDSTEEDELMYTLVNPIKNAPENTDSLMDSSGEIQNVLEKEAADDMSD